MKNLLIVVDMLNDFCEEAGVLARSPITSEIYAKPIIDPVLNRVEAYRAAGLPIIWLCDAHDKDDKEFDRFPPHAVKDTWGAHVINDLDPIRVATHPSELVIPKTRYSGFFGTDLEYQLSRLAPKAVEVIGVCTSICVMDTVGGLANRDYNITVRRDCVADFDPEAHVTALNRMQNLYGATVK